MTDAPLSRTYAAFLFDLDGTLITSTAAAERVWGRWADRHGIDRATFIPTVHGVRSAETIAAQNLPDIDIEAEVAWVERGEIEDVEGVVPIRGAVDFVRRLPVDRWAVVTSCTPDLARARMAAAGLDTPPNLITAHDVTRGKPAPDGFLKGAAMLGVDIADCLVFEDAPAGIEAGERAGAQVMVVTAAHTRPHPTSHPTLDDYDTLAVTITDQGLRLDRR